MEPKTMKFDAKKLSRLREERGMTQNTLAIACGAKAGASTISSWESGRVEPNGRYLMALARALGVTPDSLYTEV